MKLLADILPFLLIIAVFWLLILRPQRRRQQALLATQRALTLGTEVMLTSGIYGTVASLDEETIRLEVAPGTVVKVARQAIVKVLDGPDEPGPFDPGTGGTEITSGTEITGSTGTDPRTDSDDQRP